MLHLVVRATAGPWMGGEGLGGPGDQGVGKGARKGAEVQGVSQESEVNWSRDQESYHGLGGPCGPSPLRGGWGWTSPGRMHGQ